MAALVTLLSLAAANPGQAVAGTDSLVKPPTVQAKNLKEFKFCMDVLKTGEPWNWVEYCITELEFDKICADSVPGGYVAQEGGGGPPFCAAPYKEKTRWEEFVFVTVGTIQQINSTVPYVDAGVSVISCFYGNYLACPGAAKKMADLAGVDLPFEEALALAEDVNKCYEQYSVPACKRVADEFGIPGTDIIARGYEKGLELFSAGQEVYDCYDGKTEQCAKAALRALDEADVKLPINDAQQLSADLEACYEGDDEACLRAAAKLGKDAAKVIAANNSGPFAKLLADDSGLQKCIGEGDLWSCVLAASAMGAAPSIGASLGLDQAAYDALVKDISSCGYGDPDACTRVTKAFGVSDSPAIEAAKKKSGTDSTAASNVPVGQSATSQGPSQTGLTPVNSSAPTGTVAQVNANDNEDDEIPTDQRAIRGTPSSSIQVSDQGNTPTIRQIAQPTPTPTSGPPAGFKEQASYGGDCRERKPGTVCLSFPDGYVWLVSDSVQKWEDRGTVAGKPLRVAVGAKAEYQHLVGTKYVREVAR
jgi:hypothetical protein